MDQRWEVAEEEHAVRVRLSGSLGILDAEELRARLCELPRAGAVIVECGGLEHLDCAAAQVLLALRKTVVREGRDAVLENVPEGVLRYLQWGGLSEALCSPSQAFESKTGAEQ